MPSLDAYYRKSSFSGAGSCVEVQHAAGGMVKVRDSKDPSKPPHVFTGSEWAEFLEGIKNGEFDV